MTFTSPAPFAGPFGCTFPSSAHQPNPWFGSSFNPTGFNPTGFNPTGFNPAGFNWPSFPPNFGSFPGGSSFDTWSKTNPFTASWSHGSTFNPATFNGHFATHPGCTNPAWFGIPNTPWSPAQPNWNNHNWPGAGSWFGTPNFNQPSFGTPNFNQPWFGTPNFNQPSFGTPNFNQPFGFSPNSPWIGTNFGTPFGWPTPFNWTNPQQNVNWPQTGPSNAGPVNTGFPNPAQYAGQPTPNQGPGTNCEAA